MNFIIIFDFWPKSGRTIFFGFLYCIIRKMHFYLGPPDVNGVFSSYSQFPPNDTIPKLVGCFTGDSLRYKKGVFIFKIDSKFYAAKEGYHNIRTNRIILRCRKSGVKCRFMAYLRTLNSQVVKTQKIGQRRFFGIFGMKKLSWAQTTPKTLP